MIITLVNDDESKKIYNDFLYNKLKKRFDICAVNDSEYDIEAAKEAVDLFYKAAMDESPNAPELYENAYYLTALPKKDEIRAIWHRPLEQTAEEINNTIKRLAGYSINMIFIEAFYDGYTIYPSGYADIRPDLAGKPFDMMDEFIKAGKTYGVEIHAWVEDFFVGAKQFATENSCGSPIIDKHPEWAARRKDGTIYVTNEENFTYINAALDEVQDFLADLYKELIDKYKIDGIQLDYIRYPLTSSVETSVGFDDHSVKAFMDETGIDIRQVETMESPEWQRFNKWRCSNVTRFVKRIYLLAEEYRRAGRPLALSTAVFGNPDEAVRLKSQDWQTWINNGWLTFISPMAYLMDADDVYDEVRYMVENYGSIPNIAGISPMYSRLPSIEATKQVEACRRAGAAGVAFFETKFFTDKEASLLKKAVFRQ